MSPLTFYDWTHDTVDRLRILSVYCWLCVSMSLLLLNTKLPNDKMFDIL
jgi:hypothetical protein